MPADLLTYVQTGGTVGVLLFVVVAILRGWLVPGYLYKQLVRQRDDLLNAVLQSTEAAKLALQTNVRRRQDEDAGS